jgi:antitoxin (DNA-binding transcriptional repressor) of toxin-antitoxin stability system
VVIADRGQPVALLVPYHEAGRSRRFERLATLLASGLVQPAERPFSKRPPVVRGRGRLPSRLVAEGRR